jgi:hypothetical protein
MTGPLPQSTRFLQTVIDDARHNLVFFRALSHWYGEGGSNCSILGQEKSGGQEGGWWCANATVRMHPETTCQSQSSSRRPLALDRGY